MIDQQKKPTNATSPKQKPRSYVEKMVRDIVGAGEEDLLVSYISRARNSNDGRKTKIDKRTAVRIIEEILHGEEKRRAVNTIEAIEGFYLNFHADGPLYYGLTAKLDENLMELQPLVGAYVGVYDVYYASLSENFTRGSLKIWEEKRRHYYSSIVKLDGGPVEHTGYVFHMKNRLYFTGFGRDYTRPMLCYTLTDQQSLHSSVIPGIVLSIHSPEFDIYARKFILIHQENPSRNVLTDDEISGLLKKATLGSGMIRLPSAENRVYEIDQS